MVRIRRQTKKVPANQNHELSLLSWRFFLGAAELAEPAGLFACMSSLGISHRVEYQIGLRYDTKPVLDQLTRQPSHTRFVIPTGRSCVLSNPDRGQPGTVPHTREQSTVRSKFQA